ncbi:uncharacterized protein LOC132798607 isoform X1 [Drosophila nasuta]|uniref:uncharacterized protein LOC132798607 isoform X1 n=1 Tax=Drosophila nasuta TaxID=42062 RepID=UPI00295EBF3F|nr:uncharacterized protein LOC132798607 isoform X1 [Drosophila nasuta]
MPQGSHSCCHEMDRRACKESTDAELAYGLGFLAAFRQLRFQWSPGGSVGRLPAGGSRSLLYRTNDDNSEECLNPTCNCDLPVEVRRPVCVVFDESDPISALEHSFDFSSTSTQTIFVEHKAAQTDESLSQMSHQSTQYEDQGNFKKPAKKQTQKQAYPAAHYYPRNTRLSNESFDLPKRRNVLHRMLHWRQNFLQMPTISKGESPMAETWQNSDSIRKFVPEIYERLNELLKKVDKQETQVKQLQKAVDSIKHQANNNFAESSIFTQKKLPFLQPVNTKRTCDAATWTSCNSSKSTLSKTRNSSAEKRSTKVEFAEQPNSNYMLEKQYSSECQLCVEKTQPVLDDLIEKVLQLIGKRNFEDIMITVLLRADNVYHVNVQEKQSKLNLGCLLATHEAIEKAAKRGFFNQFLTYSVTDVRNTVTPPTRPFGIPFEFVSQEKTTKNPIYVEDDSEPTHSAVCEFITKVLRMPAEKINKA